jgi:hypothetical protein
MLRTARQNGTRTICDMHMRMRDKIGEQGWKEASDKNKR